MNQEQLTVVFFHFSFLKLAFAGAVTISRVFQPQFRKNYGFALCRRRFFDFSLRSPTMLIAATAALNRPVTLRTVFAKAPAERCFRHNVVSSYGLRP